MQGASTHVSIPACCDGGDRRRGLCHWDKLLEAVKNGVKTKTQNLQLFQKLKNKAWGLAWWRSG